MKKVLIMIAAMTVLSCSRVEDSRNLADRQAPRQEPGIESFEAGVVPEYISTSKGGRLECSDYRSQHGRHAMAWSWRRDGALNVDTGWFTARTGGPPSDFLVWVYSDNPNGALDISWGNQHVRYELNFSGWRSLWLRLNSDGLGEGQTPAVVDTIRLRPTAKTGTLYFDLLELTDRAIMHGRLGSDQMPFVVNDPSNRHNYPWIARQYRRSEPLPEATSENLGYYERIDASVREVLDAGEEEKWVGKAAKGYKAFRQKIRMENGKVVGPHISSHIVERYYRQKGFEGIHIHDIEGALYHVALQFQETGDPKWKELYFQYLDFMHKKGMADGSAMMNLVFVAKNAHPYTRSLMIMRPHFDQKTWQREAATVRWVSGYNNLYNPVKEPVDADKMLGDLRTLLVAIHLQPDETEEQKLSKLYDYTQLSSIVRVTMEPGVVTEDRPTRIMRPDYTICHHDQEMIFSYGYPAALSYVQLFYIFRDSPARLDADWVRGLVGVYPKFLTQSGRGPVMGARGLSAADGAGFFKMLDYAAAAGIEEAEQWKAHFREKVALSGNWYQPYAATLLHRREGWIAALRGINSVTPSPEMFGNPKGENCANVFGDQQGYGFLQLFGAGGLSEAGIDLNQGGWDWALYPGATTLRLSLDVLKDDMPTGKVKFPERTLCGGLSHFNRNGLYYQRLYAQPESLLSGIDGHKSWFFFDDVIICLGSGLRSPAVDVPMATTLFQQMHTQAEPGEEMPARDLGDHGMNLIDPAGHVYHVPEGNRVIMRRGIQHSEAHRLPFTPTQGYYSTAWLDHGSAAVNGAYEYAIKVFAGETASSGFQRQGLYEVLQKDTDAHILHYLPGKTHGYVFLNAVQNNPHGPVLETDRPVLAMLSNRDGHLELTVSDPDPDIHAPDRTVVHRLRIKGEWNQVVCLSEGIEFNSSTADGATLIAVKLKDGWSADFTLKNQ
jgi:chondroitin-sulfate-ABC endolyase/exolyase